MTAQTCECETLREQLRHNREILDVWEPLIDKLEAERDEYRAAFDKSDLQRISAEEQMRYQIRRADRLRIALERIAALCADGAVTLEQIERAALAALEGEVDRG